MCVLHLPGTPLQEERVQQLLPQTRRGEVWGSCPPSKGQRYQVQPLSLSLLYSSRIHLLHWRLLYPHPTGDLPSLATRCNYLLSSYTPTPLATCLFLSPVASTLIGPFSSRITSSFLLYPYPSGDTAHAKCDECPCSDFSLHPFKKNTCANWFVDRSV